MSSCDSFAVLIVTMGIQQFPQLLYMEPLDATVRQLSDSVKEEGFAMSVILSQFSGGGLWVRACQIHGSPHHLCTYLCPSIDSPRAVRPMSKVCV